MQTQGLAGSLPKFHRRDTSVPLTLDSDSLNVMATLGTAIRDEVCIDLGYGGAHRLIAPEKVWLSRAGNLLVGASKLLNGEVVERNYRVDRIQSARLVGMSAKAMLAGGLGAAFAAATETLP